MSDNRENTVISGNFTGRCRRDGHEDKDIFSYNRRLLVEECQQLSLSDLRSRYKRNELQSLAERKREFRVKYGNRQYEIRLCAERNLPSWRASRTSDTTRIWLLCPCGRRARRLFGDPRPSDKASTLACRACLRLRYLSQNSGKTIWFRKIVLPLRRLYRKRGKLLCRKPTQRILDQLRIVENQIQILINRAERKTGSVSRSGKRRRYKDIHLVLDRY